MIIEKLCLNCGSSFQAQEAEKEYDEIGKRWVEKEQEICNDCKKDLGVEENEE